MQWRKPINSELRELTRELEALGGGAHSRIAELEAVIRVTPKQRQQKTDYTSKVQADLENHTIVLTQTLDSTGQMKVNKYELPSIFSEDCGNNAVRKRLFQLKNTKSALNWALCGFNSAVLSYGEVNSGKTSTLFQANEIEENSFIYCMRQLLTRNNEEPGQYIFGVSIWELVYLQEERAETSVDLLKKAEKLNKEPITVNVNNLEQAESLFNFSKKNSRNYQEKLGGKFKTLNNRGHFFIRISIYNIHSHSLSHLYIIDLAGFAPMNLTREIRNRLGTDQQLNYIRIGINQFRGIVWEINKQTHSSYMSTKRSKLAQTIGPLIGGNCKTYILCTLRADSSYSEASKLLDFIKSSQEICVPCTKISNIPQDALGFLTFSEVEHLYFPLEVKKKKEILRGKQVTVQSRKSLPLPDETNLWTPAKEHSDGSLNSKTARIKLEISQIFESLEDSPPFHRQIPEQIISLDEDYKNTNLQHIFSSYESEISQLENKISALREEMSNKDLELHISDTREHSLTYNKVKVTINRLKDSVQKLTNEVRLKEKENSDLKKHQMEWNVGKTALEMMQARNSSLKATLDEQVTTSKANEEILNETRNENKRLHRDNERLRLELQTLMEENILLVQKLQ